LEQAVFSYTSVPAWNFFSLLPSLPSSSSLPVPVCVWSLSFEGSLKSSFIQPASCFFAFGFLPHIGSSRTTTTRSRTNRETQKEEPAQMSSFSTECVWNTLAASTKKERAIDRGVGRGRPGLSLPSSPLK